MAARSPRRTGGRRKTPAASPADILEAAARGEPPPVLLMTGADHFSRDAILDELKRRVLPEGTEPFNYTSLPGESLSGEELANSAEMMPMGGDRRLIVVRRAEKIREKDAAAIATYAGNPADHTTVVLLCDSGKAPIVTAVKKSALALAFPAPRDYQLSRWLILQARRLGFTLEQDAAEALADLMGENFIGAMSELQRAALDSPRAKKTITLENIQRLVAQGTDTNIFHLGDAILGREPARAIHILRGLHDRGKTGYEVLGIFEGQLRRFLKMRSQVDGGTPARQVVQSSSPTLPAPIKARITRQLESFDTERLVQAFRIARETDLAIKGKGSGTSLEHMESLVWRIAGL